MVHISILQNYLSSNQKHRNRFLKIGFLIEIYLHRMWLISTATTHVILYVYINSIIFGSCRYFSTRTGQLWKCISEMKMKCKNVKYYRIRFSTCENNIFIFLYLNPYPSQYPFKSLAWYFFYIIFDVRIRVLCV